MSDKKLIHIAQGEKTIQVTEDEWRRKRETLILDENTLVSEIFAWAKLKDVDPYSIVILPAERTTN